jgi:hypothetical protein
MSQVDMAGHFPAHRSGGRRCQKDPTMRTSLIAMAAAAFLASPALAEKNQATLSRAPVASNSTFVTRNSHVLGVDLDLSIRLGLASDRESGH